MKSELHVFRGHQPSPTGFIMGHEFTGTIVEVGSEVTSVQKGDKIVSPFTLSCGACFYCKNNFSWIVTVYDSNCSLKVNLAGIH